MTERLNRTSRNAIFSVAGYIIPLAVTFVTAPFLLHSLGDAAYGIQSLVSVVIGYFAVMDAGLDYPITKYLAEDHARGDVESQNRLLSTTLQMYALIGLVGMLGLFFAADWLASVLFDVPPELEEQAVIVFRLAGIGVLGSVGLSWGRAVGMGIQRFDMTYSVATVTGVAGTVTGLLAVIAGYGVVGYVAARVVWSFFGIFAYYALAQRLLPTFQMHWGIYRDVIKRVRGYLGYGILNRIVGSFGGRLDQTLIAVWLGVAAAGIYALPFLVVSSLSYTLAYMVGFIFPMASELHSQGELAQLRSIYVRVSSFLAAVACMTFIPLVVFGEPFLILWLGPEVAEQADTVFILLALSTFISILSATIINFVNIGVGRMRDSTIYSFSRIGMIAVGCMLFIRPLGITGAGVALLLSNIVDILYMTVSLRNFPAMSLVGVLRSCYWKPLALGLFLALPAIAVRSFASTWLNLVLVVGAYVLIYGGIALRIGIFGDYERRALFGMWSRVRAAFSAPTAYS